MANRRQRIHASFEATVRQTYSNARLSENLVSATRHRIVRLRSESSMFTHIISRSNHWLTALFDEPEYGPQDAYGIRDTILLVATGFGLTAGAAAREKIRLEGGGYRREHLRALAQRVEVAEREVRIMGSKSNLLRTLTGVSLGKTPAISVPSSVLNWRRGSPPNLGFLTSIHIHPR